jgi:hypothetical protein
MWKSGKVVGICWGGKCGKLLGKRERRIWGKIREILGRLFCSQSQKRLPIGGEGKMGQAYGFFHPTHPKKYIFFGVEL